MKKLCIFCGEKKKKTHYGNYCSPGCHGKAIAMRRNETINAAVKK